MREARSLTHGLDPDPQDAQKALAPMKKEARSCSKELQESVRAAEEAITRSLARAERENATVYLQVCARSIRMPRCR